MPETIPKECQLCRPLDYRGDEINEPEGMAEVGREDGGTKIVHCCGRCAVELFDGRLFSFYGATSEGGQINDR